jgi:hypothetical protein
MPGLVVPSVVTSSFWPLGDPRRAKLSQSIDRQAFGGVAVRHDHAVAKPANVVVDAVSIHLKFAVRKETVADRAERSDLFNLKSGFGVGGISDDRADVPTLIVSEDEQFIQLSQG